jgi:catalase
MALELDLIHSLDDLFGVHAGFRPAHAKGILLSGTFTPSPGAASLTRAPHALNQSTAVTARFSNSTGLPDIPDNDPNSASPRGFAVRFHLAEHVHTDIIGHSHDGFPTRTPEEFLEFLRAVKASGPDASKPTPIEQFLGGHPKAFEFVMAPKPIPTSFAKESFFAVSAFKFTNQEGASQFGRFRIRPDGGGGEYLDAAGAAAKTPNFLFDELTERVAKGPVKFHVVVQLAATGDVVDDATIHWPEERVQMEFGTIVLTQVVADSATDERRIIFDPIPRVDGIEPSADPLLEARAAVYLASGRRRRAASQTSAASS